MVREFKACSSAIPSADEKGAPERSAFDVLDLGTGRAHVQENYSE
jgi:hypothetical protein